MHLPVVTLSVAQCSEPKLRAAIAEATDALPVRTLVRRPGAAFVTYHNHQQAEEVWVDCMFCMAKPSDLNKQIRSFHI
jgi:hypothetical protein